MARKVLPLLAIAGAVAIFAASNNANAKSTNTNKKDDGLENLPIPPIPADKVDPIPEPTPLPPLPKLPDINDNEDLPPPKGDKNEGQVILIPNYNEIFWRYLLNNNEQPLNPVPTDLWISKTCNSWGIGKQFAGLLPAKYVYENAPNQDELISPIQWYLSSTTKTMTPVPHYVANLEQDLPYRSWARNLIIYYSGGSCGNIPRRKDFKSYKEFETVLQKFITQTNTGKLYKDLYTLIGNWLLTAWKEAYPSEYADETLKYWALWAIRNFPNATMDNQTDEAYKKAFADDKNAPKKIDVNNPNHEIYKDAWVWIKLQIKQYRDWIKKYGDFKDPLE